MSDIICPKCHTEAPSEDDSYCMICGTYLYNYCSDSSCPSNDAEQDELCRLPRHALYCPVCGSKTTFFEHLQQNK